MADLVTSQILENGARAFAAKFTNLSDGTGEAGVTKIDGSATGPYGVNIGGIVFYPGVHIKIREVIYDIRAMGVRIQWDATGVLDALILGDGKDSQKFDRLGGIYIPVGTVGATGKILFTTVGAAANSSYTITIRGTKGIHT